MRAARPPAFPGSSAMCSRDGFGSPPRLCQFGWWAEIRKMRIHFTQVTTTSWGTILGRGLTVRVQRTGAAATADSGPLERGC